MFSVSPLEVILLSVTELENESFDSPPSRSFNACCVLEFKRLLPAEVAAVTVDGAESVDFSFFSGYSVMITGILFTVTSID